MNDEGDSPTGAAYPYEPSPLTPIIENSPLTAAERELIACLFDGGSVREFERAHACIASVLVDSINEKLYDEFADICIDSEADDPIIIEDYAEELRALLG